MNILTKILKDQYAITALDIIKMEGYDSNNYKIKTTTKTYVLKVHDAQQQTIDLIRAEHEVMANLTSFHHDYSQPVPTTNGESYCIKNNTLYRVLSFIEGDFLGDIAHSPALLESFGSFLGELDKITSPLYSPVLNSKITAWDLQHFNLNYQYLNAIQNQKDKALVDYFFLQYNTHVSPLQYLLRKGILHNDANDWNVLTKNNKVTGIIDFGDMCHTWLINSVAVALTYVMMKKENPLAIAKSVLKGYQSKFALAEDEIDILYYLIAARLCTSVCNSAMAKIDKPNSEYITISEKPAWNLLYKWVSINPIKAANEFREVIGVSKKPNPDISSELIHRRTNLSASLSLSYSSPIYMQQAAFQYMYDVEGNTYLDAYNNIMLAGHCHPTVVRAGQKAMAALNTNTRYIYKSLQDYSTQLLAKFPASLCKIFFVNSGSAATDLALRLAKHHTKKQHVLGLEHGYHGNTDLAIQISHYKYAHKNGIGKQPTTVTAPMPNAFNSGYKDNGEAGTSYAEKVREIVSENHQKIAAFIAEPIVGCGGQVPLAKDYLKQVYPIIRAQGGVCISDEVQVGFGRLGHHFWGYEMHAVVPDIVILGKPMGNGHPIGAVVTTQAIANSFADGPEFFSSFGGNPVSCAIGKAVLDVIEAENLQENAKTTGDYFISELKKLQKEHPIISDVRGMGLFIGVEILHQTTNTNQITASMLSDYLKTNHILVGTDGPLNNVIKIKPPLTFNKTNVDQVIATMNRYLKNV